MFLKQTQLVNNKVKWIDALCAAALDESAEKDAGDGYMPPDGTPQKEVIDMKNSGMSLGPQKTDSSYAEKPNTWDMPSK